mgnify:CR=1 FL=1
MVGMKISEIFYDTDDYTYGSKGPRGLPSKIC